MAADAIAEAINMRRGRGRSRERRAIVYEVLSITELERMNYGDDE